MGKIIIGRENRRGFESLTGYEGRKAPGKRGMTIEEQRVMAEKLIKGLPESQWVGVLMSHGLNDAADEVNRELVRKAAYEAELKAKAAAKAEDEAIAAEEAEKEKERAEKLAGIMAMPEDERLVALVENGFEEEAQALVEAKAAAKVESEDADAGAPAEGTVGDEAGTAESGKKNVTSKKKSGKR